MSIQAITWAWQQDVGSATERLILIAIADFCDEHSQCFPSQAKLAERAMCSTDTVQRALRKMEAMGLLSRRKRGRKSADGGRLSDIITLPVRIDIDTELSRNLRPNQLNRKSGVVKPQGVRFIRRTVTVEPSLESSACKVGTGSSYRGNTRAPSYDNGSIDTDHDIDEVPL